MSRRGKSGHVDLRGCFGSTFCFIGCVDFWFLDALPESEKKSGISLADTRFGIFKCNWDWNKENLIALIRRKNIGGFEELQINLLI